ncbi:sugar phosphate isomerase/epimerase family protein [Streptosporangium sp. CA-135522]|uniref:sugar phosphate isomerase/epimerase family protein n=1 Tax=Streptosporangium sp. CA-135522 TaxID=3240072 RepID=UPI003D8ABE4E
MSPLAVQLYSVREQAAADRRAVLRRIAEIGYGAVEPYDAHVDPGGLAADLEEVGLRVCSVHAPLLGDLRGTALAAATRIGADTVIVPAAPAEWFATRDGLERAALALNEAAREAADHGLRLGYHNHWWELEQRVEGRPALEVLADLLEPEVLLEVDVYWAATGGTDPAGLLARLGGRVRHLHVKDGPATKEGPMTAVGSGEVPIVEALAAAPEAVRIVELDHCAGDMLEALADSHAYLTGLAETGPVSR